MGLWIKTFSDNTTELGSDKDIEAGLASWSKGRLSDIKEVQLSNDRVTCRLLAPNTNWHQFDRYAAQVVVGQTSTVKPVCLYRVIQAELQKHHLGNTLVCSRSGTRFYWAIVQECKVFDTPYFFSKSITQPFIGQWLTIVLPKEDYPYIRFSERGKINDNKHLSG
jgi:hypothetical protein